MSPERSSPQQDATPLCEVNHNGLMLPLYATEDVVWNKQQLKLATESGQDNVVRYIRLKRGVPFILSELLETARQTFEAFCHNKSGIKLIDHSWGLSVTPPEILQTDDSNEPLTYSAPQLPGNISLTAKVSLIKDTYPCVKLQDRQKIVKAVEEHLRNTDLLYRWIDAKPPQFVQNDDGLYLVDIEPLFSRRIPQPQSQLKII